MRAYLAILQFMTRIPVPARWTASFDFSRTHEGVIWFPLLGLTVGVLGAVAYALGLWLLDPWLAAACYLLALALVTGAFHLDGLADTCDGLFSARKREQMLEIMKDSRLGTNGALALLLAVLFRLLAVIHLSSEQTPHLWALLVAAPIAGRALMVLLMHHQRYAREQGLGNVFIGKVSDRQCVLTLLLGLLLVTLLGGGRGALAFLLTALFALAYRRFVVSRLGGQTGDTLGAGNELFEVWFLLMLC